MTRRSDSQYTSSRAALADAHVRPYRVGKSVDRLGKFSVIDNATADVVEDGLTKSTARRRMYALELAAGFVANDPVGA
jgi:hypothetical protein